MSQDVLDVAIVGGGVSGCYCGYRLLTAGSGSPTVQNMLKASGRDSLSIALYEASDRIGGRLWSYRFPETPNLVAELGGIGFSPLHANVYGLCTQELHLAQEPADEFSVYDLQYIRRHRFNFGDYCPANPDSCGYYPRVVPYFLDKDEKGRIPTDLMLAAFGRAVPASSELLDELSKEGCTPEKAWPLIAELRDLLRSACDSNTGVPIHDCGFWNLLSRHASQEAHDMALNSSGFYSTTENWNAYDTLLGCLVDFSVPQVWTKLRGGYDTLPLELAKRFVARGGELKMQTRLVGLDIQGEGADVAVAMRLEANGATSTQLARNVILAMPQRSVRLLDPNTFLFRNRQFTDDLSSVTCEPATKLFLTFPEPWWRKVPVPKTVDPSGFIQCGQSATDLPIRLCYYLGSEENGTSLLLASFTDSIGVEYWNGYLPQRRSGLSDAPTRHGPSRPIDPPSAMVRDAVRQLATMHGVEVPEALSAAFVHWGEDPYGGGYHFWNTHLRSWEVMPRIRRPSRDANVFLCGEAFSAKQGWVEGAINTAEMTLETYFGLPRPGWAPTDYDFGP